MMQKNFDLVYLSREDLEVAIEKTVFKLIGNKKPDSSNEYNQELDYYTLEQAMKILGRKKTWFHNKRKSEELPAKKSGNQWWYKKEDIKNYIENGKGS